VYEIDKAFNVSLIIHPENKDVGINYLNIKNKIFAYGFVWGILKIVSILYNRLFCNSMRNSINSKANEYYYSYLEKYNNISYDKIHNVDSINSKDSIQLIKDNDIDVICNLGGDIYQKEIINSVKEACINYHSGISPFYNGNKTIFHACSDFRANFAGGTLMFMNERIDGGNIISHYLVPINKKDNSADLFMKNIQGSVKLFLDALTKIDNGIHLNGIPQKRSFKYLRNIDWSIMNDLRLRHFEISEYMKRYERKEKIITYYDGVGDHSFQKTLFAILDK